MTENDIAALMDWNRTALHEAGHAVVGEVLGYPCRYLKQGLWMPDRRYSKLLRSYPSSPKAKQRWAEMGVATAAGVAAEAIAAGTDITDALRRGPGKEDYELMRTTAYPLSLQVYDVQTMQPVRSVDSYIAEWESRAMSILKENWAWVEAVAGRFIMAEGYLSGAEVRECRELAA